MILLVVASLLIVQIFGDAIPVRKSLVLEQNNRVKRVTGGHYTDIDLHPWIVSIKAYGVHYCGGSIINSRVVLTAARCTRFPRFSLNDWTVQVGSAINDDGSGSEYKVVDSVRHPDFSNESKGGVTYTYNDLGLLKVRPPFKFGEMVRPVQLAGRERVDAPGTPARVAGWGWRLDGGRSGSSQRLKGALLYIQNKTECMEKYSHVPRIDWSGLFCAAAPGRDRCKYDDGGPLTVDDVQVGIISWAKGCAQPGFPGVYTNVSVYRDWIDEKSQYLESPQSDHRNIENFNMAIALAVEG